MEIEYSRTAANVLQRMPKNLRNAIRQAIQGLTLMPPQGDIKPMQGYSDGRYRLRVGGYRVIYRYDNRGNAVVLHVMKIGSRGDVYK